jgi:hypothetical protein
VDIYFNGHFEPMFRIRIQRIHTFMDLSINKQKNLEKPWFLQFCHFLLNNLISLKTDVNVPTVSNKQKKFEQKDFFCWHLEATKKRSGFGSVNQRKGYPEPESYQNVTDQHCFEHSLDQSIYHYSRTFSYSLSFTFNYYVVYKQISGPVLDL